MARPRHVYQAVTGVGDLREINRTIRGEVKIYRTHGKMTQLYRRSMYLVTLTSSYAWKKSFKGSIRRMKDVAKEEFTKTAKSINRRCMELKIDAVYDEVYGRGKKG